MKIILDSEVINFHSKINTTGLTRTHETQKNLHGNFSLHTMQAGKIRMYSVYITAHTSTRASIKIESKGIYLILAEKNAFVKIPDIKNPLQERACNLIHSLELNVTIELKAGQEYGGLIIQFSPSFLQDAKPDDLAFKIFVSFVQQNKPANIALFNFVASSQLLFHIKEMKCSNTIAQLITRGSNLLEYLSANSIEKYQTRKVTPSRLYDLCIVTSYIRSNYKTPLSIPEIITGAEVSYNTVKKYFKSFTTLKVGEYVNEQRILEAIQLLLTTTDCIKSIAIRSGFPNAKKPTTFNHIFKRFVGISPSEYRIIKTNNVPLPVHLV